jgi:hypothetical protein
VLNSYEDAKIAAAAVINYVNNDFKKIKTLLKII